MCVCVAFVACNRVLCSWKGHMFFVGRMHCLIVLLSTTQYRRFICVVAVHCAMSLPLVKNKATSYRLKGWMLAKKMFLAQFRMCWTQRNTHTHAERTADNKWPIMMRTRCDTRMFVYSKYKEKLCEEWLWNMEAMSSSQHAIRHSPTIPFIKRFCESIGFWSKSRLLPGVGRLQLVMLVNWYFNLEAKLQVLRFTISDFHEYWQRKWQLCLQQYNMYVGWYICVVHCTVYNVPSDTIN